MALLHLTSCFSTDTLIEPNVFADEEVPYIEIPLRNWHSRLYTGYIIVGDKTRQWINVVFDTALDQTWVGQDDYDSEQSFVIDAGET